MPALQGSAPVPATQGTSAPAGQDEPSSPASTASAARALEQRALQERKRIFEDNDADPGLLQSLLDDAVELLFADETELGALASLDARVTLARMVAGRSPDPEAGMRVELEYASALQERDPDQARAVLRAALARDPQAHELLVYGQLQLYELDVQAEEWDEADQLFAVLTRALEARLNEQRAGARPDERTASLGLRIDLLAHRITQCCRLGLLDLGCTEGDRLSGAVQELRATDEARARAGGSAPMSDAAIVRGSLNAGFATAFLRMTCEDYVGLLTAVEELEALRPSMQPMERLRCDYYRAYAHSELERTGQTHDLERAERLYSEAVSNAAGLFGSETPASDLELDLSIGLLDIYIRQHRGAEAEQRLRVIEAALPRIRLPEARERLARLRVLVNRSRLARLEHAERSALPPLRDELADAYTGFLQSLERSKPRPGGLGFLHWGTRRELISECIDTELSLDSSEEGRRRALELALRAQNLGTFARRLQLGAATLVDVRSRLLDERGCLVFVLPALECTHLFLVGRSFVEHFRTLGRAELLERARAFSRCVETVPERPSTPEPSDRRRRVLTETGRALADVLFPDDARTLIERCDALYFSGLELLESPPIEALPWRGNETLGCVLATAHLPSVAEGLWLLERADAVPRPESDLVLLTSAIHGARVVREQPELRPLDLSTSEIDALVAGFESSRVRRLSGSAATLDRLAQTAEGCSGLLELFAHGVPSANPERPAAIAVSAGPGDEGLLDCDWIERCLRPPPFVFLFACGSALGPTRLGDDTATQLGNSLLFKGARVVLLSRSRLSLDAMLALDASLHRHLADAGATPAEAMRRARMDLRRSPQWDDPFYYGTVQLLGVASSEVRAMPGLTIADRDRGGPRAWLVGSLLLLGLVLLMLVPAVLRRRARPK